MHSRNAPDPREDAKEIPATNAVPRWSPGARVTPPLIEANE